ncbi:MAG: HAMP domain-containing histidine kinase [Clostridiales bacterium]|nr:HAMP domain-containing histidine kinase [Candidatus Crickella equi]
MNLNTKKTIYGILAFLAPLVGTACGVLGAAMVGVASMEDATSEMVKHLAENDIHLTDEVHFLKENAQRDFISNNFIFIIILAAAFLAMLVGLCILTGEFDRYEDGRVRLNWFDKIWTELHITVCGFSAFFAVACAIPLVKVMPQVNWLKIYEPVVENNYVFDPISNANIVAISIVGMACFIELAILTFVSIVKKFKAHKFLETALLGKFCIAVWRGCKSLIAQLSVPNDNDEKAGKKLMLKYILLVAAMIILAMSWIGVLVDIVIFMAIVPNKIKKYMNIRKGVVEIKNGNLGHQIYVEKDLQTGEPRHELDKLATDINQIALSSNTAVQNEIKVQRMKTDLISNVSHDLKTPLTSMISYLDILQKEGLDSPNAQEYLDIVQEKTEKLKTLTEDLFEAAKASSGNIPCELATIDLNDMLDQELAEMDAVLTERKLDIIKTVKADNTKVQADGKLLSRVLENLLGNIAKYALDNSRVYIDISNCSNQLQLDIKNISRDQLNISPDELMERFTRGDDSRNTEGSGLGLAIAKDLTRVMGGYFELTIDGDMFKATVKLNK